MFYDLIFKPSIYNRVAHLPNQTHTSPTKPGIFYCYTLYYTSAFNIIRNFVPMVLCMYNTCCQYICDRTTYLNSNKCVQKLCDNKEFKMFASSILRTCGHCGPFSSISTDCYFARKSLYINLKAHVIICLCSGENNNKCIRILSYMTCNLLLLVLWNHF